MNLINPLVTVRVPSYNHEKYVKRAILSVVNQTFQDFELIVIDDCSTDQSHEIISDLQAQYGFTYIRHSENKGLIYSMNEFLDLAKGKYISGCSSDDYWELQKLEKQVSFMENNPDYAVCFGRMRAVKPNNQIISVFPKYAKSGYIFRELFLKEFFIPSPTSFMKVSVLKEVGGYSNEYFIEDTPIWLKIAEKYPIGFIPMVLTNRGTHGKNMSTNNPIKILNDQKKIIDTYRDNKYYSIALRNWYLQSFSFLARNYKREAVKYCFLSLRSCYKRKFLTSLFSLLFRH